MCLEFQYFFYNVKQLSVKVKKEVTESKNVQNCKAKKLHWLLNSLLLAHDFGHVEIAVPLLSVPLLALC